MLDSPNLLPPRRIEKNPQRTNSAELARLKNADRGSFDRFEWVSALVSNNHDGLIRCDSCTQTPNPEKRATCMNAAIFHGHAANDVLFFDGADRNLPLDTLGAHAPSVFLNTTPWVMPYTQGVGAALRSSPRAALAYGDGHLGIRQGRVFGSSDSPMAIEINDFWEASDLGRNLFTDPRLEYTKPIYEAARKAAQELNRDSRHDLDRLTALQLLWSNTDSLQGMPNHRIKLTATFLDTQQGNQQDILTAFLPHKSSLKDLFLGNAGSSISVPHRRKNYGAPHAYCCLCCDGRAADGSRPFGKDRVLHSHSISVLIPRYDPKDPTWMGIIRAKKLGAPITIVMGHSDCGGISALVDKERMRRKGGNKSFGEFLDPWLAQATEIVAGVFDYIEANRDLFPNLDLDDRNDKRLYELVARRVKTWSALNVSEYMPAVACFQNLHEGKIEFLPLHDKIEDTYARMINPERKIFLPDATHDSLERRECAVSQSFVPDAVYTWVKQTSAALHGHSL